MQITDVSVVLHDRRSETLAVFGRGDGRLPMGVLRVFTDDGVEGNAFLTYPGPGPSSLADQIVGHLRPLLVGQDPLDIGLLWGRMSRAIHLSPMALGAVDIALWDIAGKVAGLPVHRLLGTCRDRIPVYFSSGHHDSPEAYADEALYWRDRGWKGYKLHPPRALWRQGPRVPVSSDIAQCTAVREAAGDSLALMLDASWGYSYTEALQVGRAIEELDYLWYEDPLGPQDIHGYTRLKRHLRIPILATEVTPGGLYALPQWITERATDFLRGDVLIKGGITGLMKIAHLAEAFGMNCEIHDAYNALGNVANQHVMMAIDNCQWFEVIAFNRSGDHSLEHLSYGLTEPFEVDAEGCVHAHTRPGLGVEIDWELINSARIGDIT